MEDSGNSKHSEGENKDGPREVACSICSANLRQSKSQALATDRLVSLSAAFAVLGLGMSFLLALSNVAIYPAFCIFGSARKRPIACLFAVWLVRSFVLNSLVFAHTTLNFEIKSASPF